MAIRHPERDGKEGRWQASLKQSISEGEVAFAVQPHHDVRPESGLVGIVEHIEVNKR